MFCAVAMFKSSHLLPRLQWHTFPQSQSPSLLLCAVQEGTVKVQQTGEQSALSKYPRSLSMTSPGGWDLGESPSGLEALEMGSCAPSSPKRRTSCSWRKLPVGAGGSSVSDEACGKRF